MNLNFAVVVAAGKRAIYVYLIYCNCLLGLMENEKGGVQSAFLSVVSCQFE